MKFLLLSLLPLAVDLAAARPAVQAESAALTRRNSPPPPADLLQRPEQPGSALFSQPEGYDYSSPLKIDLTSDAAAQFLGLGDDEVADLESMFTDDKPVNVATRPGLKIPEDAYDVSTAFLNDGSSDIAFFDIDGTLTGDDTTPAGDKATDKTSYKAYRPGFPVPDPASFDPKATDFFDDKGLPTKVVFSPTDDYKAMINFPTPTVSAAPSTDYSLFLNNPPAPQPQ